MALSDGYLREVLNKYISSNGKTAASSMASTASVADVCEQFKEDMGKVIAAVIPGFDTSGIQYTTPTPSGDGQIRVVFSFTDESIHRESLDPSKYADGTDPYGGIVLMFSKGWNAHGQINGDWVTHTGNVIKNQWSLSARPSNPFLQMAIQDFNTKYSDANISAELLGEYSGV